MKLMERVKMLFGHKQQRRQQDPIEAQVKIAVQQNEAAGEKAREALEEYKMTQTLKNIAGRM